MKLYFDTAYVAKCYLTEPDSAAVRKLAYGAEGLYSSAWCIAELACVFHRYVREGSLQPGRAARLRRLFLEDVGNGVWELFPISERLLFIVELATRGLPATVYLRAGDAVHLVSAREAGFSEIWSNDRHLLRAAEFFGLTGKSL